MVSSPYLAALLFAVSGAIAGAIFSAEVHPYFADVKLLCTGIPFSVLSAVLCVRRWPWVGVSAVLQCLTWAGAYWLSMFLYEAAGGSVLTAVSIPGAAGAACVAIATSIRRPRGSSVGITVALASVLGLAGGIAFFAGWTTGFILWQSMVGTWLFLRADTRQNTRSDSSLLRIFPGVAGAAIYKLGWLPVGSTAEQEYRHGHRYEREKTNGRERLRIGPERDAIQLMLALAECIAAPVFVLYVLHAPLAGSEAARYDSPNMDRNKLAEFIWKFSEFFQRDARHDLWISRADGKELVVLDSHGLLFAYGPLEQYTAVLLEHGLKEGTVAIPAPHTHRYHEQFHPDEVEVVRYFDWSRSRLVPGDGE
jgi:hypothetical protein